MAQNLIAASDVGREMPRISNRALWGLYSVYIAIGLVYGFWAANLGGVLICQNYFGPYGEKGGTDGASCTLGPNLFNFSWSLKVFIALLVDNFKIVGSRKRWWVLGGWGLALCTLAISAILVPSFHNAKDHQASYFNYVLIMSAMNCFIAFADVAADGMGVAYTKLEPDEQRGSVIATGYQCRFVATIFSGGLVKLFLMGGKQFVSAGQNPPFDFGLDLNMIHWLLLLVTLPFFVCMVLWIEDPPLTAEEEHGTGCAGVWETIKVMWKATQSYAVFNLVLFAMGINAIAAIQNPADKAASNISDPTSVQQAVGTMAGYALLMVGLNLYKRYLLDFSKRSISMWCNGATAVLPCLELVIIYFGVSMPKASLGWFYNIQGDLPQLTQAIAFCLVQVTVAEIAPAGMEASIYEFLLSASNISQTVSNILTAMGQKWLGLKKLNRVDFLDAYHNNKHLFHEYQTHMTMGVLGAAVLALAAAVLFSLCMPKGPEECRQWTAKREWQVPSVSAANFGILGVMIAWSLEQTLFSLAGVTSPWLDTVDNTVVIGIGIYAGLGVAHRIVSSSRKEAVAVADS